MKAKFEETNDIEAAINTADAYVDKIVAEREIQKLCNDQSVTDSRGLIVKEGGTVICTSACYFAAKAAGIDNESNQVNHIIMSVCMEKFRDKVTRLEADARKKSNAEAFIQSAR